MSLKKNILRVFSANFIQLLSSIIVGFFVPAILSVDGYASLKTYTLYISYIGMLSFGFIDGIYIKYGGQNIDNIDKGILKGEHYFLITFQFIIMITFSIISVLTKDIIIFLFAITILPTVMVGFHQNLNQATGNFKKYTRMMYIYSILYMVINVILALIFKSQNYIYYCVVSFICNLIVFIIYEYKFMKQLTGIKAVINKKDIINNMKIGFFILLGNIAVISFYSIDKWFVKLLLSTQDFAFYSFAISMLNIVNTLITAISIIFYNYLFNNNSKEKIKRLETYLLILGSIASISYFVLAFIVNNFIEKYLPSLDIIAITFATFPYLVVIKALIVNLYKVNENKKQYVKVVSYMLIVSIIYNIIAYTISHSMQAIALATLCAFITWYIYSSITVKNLCLDKKNLIFTFFITIIFLLTSHLNNYIIGGLVYTITLIICIITLYKDITKEILQFAKIGVQQKLKMKSL